MNNLIIFGLIGGLIPELISLYNLRQVEKIKRPEWMISIFYWCMTALMICAGGLVVWFYQTILHTNINELMAIHLGASAPVLLQAMGQGKLKVD